MLKYNGYAIVTEPDYLTMIKNGESVDGVFCEVFDENDTGLMHKLDEFSLVRKQSFEENTIEDIERAIKEVVNEDMTAYELAKAQNELEKSKGLLKVMVNKAIDEYGFVDMYDTLKVMEFSEEQIQGIMSICTGEPDEGMKMV